MSTSLKAEKSHNMVLLSKHHLVAHKNAPSTYGVSKTTIIQVLKE